MAKILITGALKLSETMRDEIQKRGFEILWVQNECEPLSINHSDIDAIICNALLQHNDIDEFTSLKYIQTTSAGLDRMPICKIHERGIALHSAGGVYSIPMAEWVVMGILSLLKESRSFYDSQKAELWSKRRELRELYGSRALIVGYGSVGREVALRLRAFGVEITALDLRPIEDDLVTNSYLVDELNDCVSNQDIIVLCLPLTSATHHLFDASIFGLIRRGTILVNIARGALVDENAMVAALEEGLLGGAVLDVFQQEPLPAHSPLWRVPRVIITPHNSFVSSANQERLERLILKNLNSYGKQ